MLAFKSLFAVAGFLATCFAAPAPIPNGGVGVRFNDTPPVYADMSDFDFQSLNLALNQEWIELDLFNYGVARFSMEEFASAGLGPDDVSLINFMANQEVGHSTLIANLLQGRGARRCDYRYTFETVRDFVNFCQRLTRWGESGVYGFINHLDSRPAAQLLLQSIATEARQQMIFRQFSGAHPMPVYFETGISQAMSWSLLAPYIVSCPAANPHIEFPNYPLLSVTNDANLLQDGYLANITHNRTSLTEPGREITLTWSAPGKPISYTSQGSSNITVPSANGSMSAKPSAQLYNTSIGGLVNTTTPSYVAFISQLNVTYAPLTLTGNYSGTTIQPGGIVYNGTDDNIVNGTMFIAAVSEPLNVTPYNISLLNDYIFAFGLYQAD